MRRFENIETADSLSRPALVPNLRRLDQHYPSPVLKRRLKGLTMLEQLMALGAILIISAGIIYGGSVVFTQANLSKAQNEISMLISSSLAYRESPARSNFVGISFSALESSGAGLPYSSATASNAFGQNTTIAPVTSTTGADCTITYQVGNEERCKALESRFKAGEGNIKTIACDATHHLVVTLD